MKFLVKKASGLGFGVQALQTGTVLWRLSGAQGSCSKRRAFDQSGSSQADLSLCATVTIIPKWDPMSILNEALLSFIPTVPHMAWE